jgi:hypothetical protein
LWQIEKAPEKWILRVSVKISGTSRQKTGQQQQVCAEILWQFNLAMNESGQLAATDIIGSLYIYIYHSY